MTRAPDWWRRGLDDGKHAASRGRAKFFLEYLAVAELAMAPTDEFSGAFWTIYRQGFRYGYDGEIQRRKLENKYASRPRKRRVKLG